MKKSLALLAVLASFSCAAPPPPPTPAPAPAPATAPNPPALKADDPVAIDGPRAELIKKLDEMVQWRFSKITPEDVRTRRFGVNRLGPPRKFHVEGLAIAPAVNRLAEEGWSAGLYVVRDRDESNAPGAIRGPVAANGGAWTAIEDRRAVEEIAHRALAAKTEASGASHGIPLQARLVPVSAPICQKCHAGKEIGEPVAAVVYAFHRERPSVATPGRDSGR